MLKISNIFFFLKEGRIKAILRVWYYKFFLKVKWQPSYDLVKKIYGVKMGKVKMFFYDPPFHDIECALLDYITAVPVKKSKIYIDAGSFIGTFAIYISKLSKTNFIVAIEPDEENYQKLLKNVKLNKSGNVTVLKKALWRDATSVQFRPGQGEMSQIAYVKAKKIDPPDTVKATTIDEIYRKIGKRIDYIKMDIEGAEIEALSGAINCIKKSKPRLVIATYHVRNNERTQRKVEKLLRKYYHNVYSVNLKQLLTVAINS